MSKFDPKIIAGSPRRNKFDLSYYTRLTSRMGDLVPVMCKKIVPSDEFRVSINAITRFAPLANPIYDRVRIDYDAFFVQNRIIDPNFKEFLTGGLGLAGETSTEGMHNISVVGSFTDKALCKKFFGNASLLDFLGLSLTDAQIDSFFSPSGNFGFRINAEPLLSYYKIYEDWYRNERFQRPVYSDFIKLMNTSNRLITLPQNVTEYTLLKRNYSKDPYTTALADPLIGGPVPIMSGLAPIVAPQASTADSTIATTTNEERLVYRTVDGTPDGSLFADLSSVVSNTVQQLNQMYALYRFFMKDTYNGNRYVEFIESHFGVRVPDSTLERPLFLGRHTQVAAFSEVYQTSGATASGNTLGDYAGKGVCAGNGFLFQQKFLEHGYLFVIMSIVPEASYFQGISPIFFIGDRFDSFYFPEFQNIGDVSIPTSVLWSGDAISSSYLDSTSTKVNNKIFGYQRRNWDLIWYPNELHGLFRQDNQLYNWTFAREFTSSPVLGDGFSKIPEINNPFTFTAAEAEPYYTDILFDIKALRPVERYESITTH